MTGLHTQYNTNAESLVSQTSQTKTERVLPTAAVHNPKCFINIA